MHILIRFVSLGLLSASFSMPAQLYAAFSAKEGAHLHHFFNARLIPKNEHQISVVGNYKYGALETLEIGTQALALVAGGWNGSLKHRMFAGQDYETSFTSHALYYSSEQTTSDSPTKESFFASAFGIITTHDLGEERYLNWGLLDYYLGLSIGVDNSDLSAHVLSMVIGYDQYLNRNWALSGVLAYPALLTGRLESDYSDAEVWIDMINGTSSTITPSTLFLTAIYNIDHFNIEFGIVSFSQITLPYFNVFWRFR